MLNSKKMLVVVGFVGLMSLASVKANILNTSAGGQIPNLQNAMRVAAGPNGSLAQWNAAMDTFIGYVTTQGLTTVDKSNLFALIDQNASGNASQFLKTSSSPLYYTQAAYNAVIGVVNAMAATWGTVYSAKLTSTGSGNFFAEFKTAPAQTAVAISKNFSLGH